ncbi:arsenic resistance protein [Jeotgalibacillus haloalkalitolerans]|uniref:Arsenic resistance protein n=1 Tax=Jeotgalibacillus haloalkalitolerans TaxID=3104292 RepID=A0ABU5KPG8_9BACL|nr:arsenic resistance protein [Jeotgalibacillus sp. HH7-29]MDZ5712856.1 arsenic resistance protein [Jeotgalibacillus sp. HH7-29]
MKWFEKLYTFFILGAVGIGLVFSQLNGAGLLAEVLILPLLAFMIYLTFLQIPSKEIKASFRNKTFSTSAVLINFLWTPFFAWVLTLVFFPDQPALAIGLIMLLVTPCTDWYLIFTGVAKGNTALSAAILPLNLILQIILLPVYLFIFFGAGETVETAYLVEGVIWVLFVPLMLAALTKALLKGKRLPASDLLQNLPAVFLVLAIVAMFAAQGNMILENAGIFLQILPPLAIFFAVNFFISRQTGKLCKLPAGDRVSLTMTTLARNSPLALAIAVAAFPNEPLIALILVIGPLIELPVLALVSKVLVKMDRGN